MAKPHPTRFGSCSAEPFAACPFFTWLWISCLSPLAAVKAKKKNLKNVQILCNIRENNERHVNRYLTIQSAHSLDWFHTAWLWTSLCLSLSVFPGWTPFRMTLPNRRDTPGSCVFPTHTRAQTASRCPTATCYCTWATSLSWACPPRLRSSTTG